MKSRLALAFLLLSILCIVGAGTVSADQDQGYQGWSPIKNTGYAVISNYQGMDVPVGQTVWVTAGTTDLTITCIVFRWNSPDGHTWEDRVYLDTNNNEKVTPSVPDNVHNEVLEWATANPGVKYLYAQSANQTDVVGDWGVQALFIGSSGKAKASATSVIKARRATSFNVVPDLPVVGTAGALVTMLFGLGLFLHRKRQ